MDGFLEYFSSDLHPSVLRNFFHTLPLLFQSSYLPFWLFILLPFVRFVLPTLVAWSMTVVRPRLFDQPVSRALIVANPLVSVVVAAHNEAHGIAGALRSILNCGYGNLEIILVDDGSTDGTAAVARNVAAGFGQSTSASWNKLRVFSSRRRNGKASALNIGLSMARGEYIVIMDADNEFQYGIVPAWLAGFTDDGVGAVVANLRVANADTNLLTRLQDVEFSVNVLLWRMIAAKIGVLAIVSGGGAMFRARALRAAGGFDSGLGEDTDMTLRIIKMGWRPKFALDAIVWANAPTTLNGLIRQRVRWARNMVKIRLSKHSDTLSLFQPYGWQMGFIAMHTLFIRTILVWAPLFGLIYLLISNPTHRPIFITGAYGVLVTWAAIKLMIVRDLAGTPTITRLAMIPLMPFYYTVLRLVSLWGIAVELTRLQTKHAYVPNHIWEETPHW
ncbi:MAG TPA: glycosyltransferase [Stellaceae bacterium]|nr:glycosyltransferase [Stellaceae bacterium]